MIAGNGGDGCVAFRREKFVPKGGPSGGDGGDGGSVYIECSDSVNTLLHFQYKRIFKAQRGRHGEGSKRHGKNGSDITVLAPPGTQVFKEPEHEMVHDFEAVGQRMLFAQGGKGGRGNARFTSSTNQAPRHFEPGRPGEEVYLSLNLKLIADVGLVGFPNVGKSTLISRISASKSKVASYPFTTLQPHLGVVQFDEYRSFVIADIPGLIEGAHKGHGLGDQFLKHVERTRILVHLIDISENGRDPVADYDTIVKEISLYNCELLERGQLVVASKIDVLADASELSRLEEMCRNRDIPFVGISAVTGQGIKELIGAISKMLAH